MQTSIPIFETTCISQVYPTIRGFCEEGIINIYDEKYNLIKSVTVTSVKFFINLEELKFKAIVIKNTRVGYAASEFSNIMSKCCEAVPCIKRVKVTKCPDSSIHPCQAC